MSQPKLTPLALQQLAEDAGRSIVAKIAEVHGPIWAHRVEFAKLIVSLASAIIVGTITFSEALVGSGPSFRLLWVLFGSWGFLLLSLVLSLSSLWTHTNLISFHAAWTNAQPRLLKRIGEINIDDPMTVVVETTKIVAEESNAVLKPVGEADKTSQRLLRDAFIAFVLGLGAFLAFGAIRLSGAAL